MSHPIMWGAPQVQVAQSLIEARQNIGVEINTHIVEWFSGDALDSIWTDDSSLSGSIAMADVADNGLDMITGTTNQGTGAIGFGGGVGHYVETGSGFVVKAKISNTTSTAISMGLADDVASITDGYYWKVESSDTNFQFTVRSGGASSTDVDLGIAKDTNYHTVMGKAFSTHLSGYIDGDFAGASTTTRPDQPLEPAIRTRTQNTTSKTGNVKYFEAWNS